MPSISNLSLISQANILGLCERAGKLQLPQVPEVKADKREPNHLVAQQLAQIRAHGIGNPEALIKVLEKLQVSKDLL